MSKALPSSLPAEQALIGLMIQDNSVVSIANEQGLLAEDFFDIKHRIITQAIFDLYSEHKEADIATLSTRLKDQGNLSRVGGDDYLFSLYEMGDANSKAPQYITTIKNKNLLRQLIKATEDIQNEAFDRSYAEEEVLRKARQAIVEIVDSQGGSEFKKSIDLFPQVVDEISKFSETKKNIGVYTGIPRFDSMTGGFKRGALIILAARTSVGKTAFATNILTYAAVHEKKNVVFFNLEMSATEIATRMIAIDGEIPSEELARGKFTGNNANALMESGNRLANASIYIDDTSAIRITDILSKCKKLKADLEVKGKTLDLVIVDYLQLVGASRRGENRQVDVSEVSRGLKEVARTVNAPVIALSQLSRESTKRNTAPQLTDLRESGSIEQDADMVIFLHNKDEAVEKVIDRNVDLTIGKNRSGRLGFIPLKFDTTCGIFKEISDQYEEV